MSVMTLGYEFGLLRLLGVSLGNPIRLISAHLSQLYFQCRLLSGLMPCITLSLVLVYHLDTG